MKKTKNGERYRDYYQEAKTNILNQIHNLKDVHFCCEDYINFHSEYNCFIYADPPYKNTKQYKNSINFDYEKFWNKMRELSENNIVIISELNAPNDFECIWEGKVSRSIKSTDKTIATEKLFKLRK